MSRAGGNYVLALPNGLVAVVLSQNSYNAVWTGDDRLTLVGAATDLKRF